MLEKFNRKIRLVNEKFRKRWHDALIVLSVFHGKKAFVGPTVAQFDITNRCNNNCIACWARSPLLKEREATKEWKSMELPVDKIKGLINELSEMGTKRIFFAGGGEPFIHPYIFEILEHVKTKGMFIDMNTNFTLVDKKTVKKIISLGVDHMNVSLWAATPKTYSKTHPNKDGRMFLQIEKMLNYLNKAKQFKPSVTVYNVISNLNYNEYKKMVEFGFKVKADSIEFVLVDTIPRKTDKLLLDERQRNELLSEVKKTKDYIKEFSKRHNHSLQIPCLPYFQKRISDPKITKGVYETNLIESIPCYAGWSFTRISATGNVDPCLKAHKVPVGNVHISSFKKIWNNAQQQEFRKQTFVKVKKGPYFSKIGEDSSKDSGCYSSCDNLGLNSETHDKLIKFACKNKLFKLVKELRWKNLM